MKDRVLALAVSRYSFKEEGTNDIKTGGHLYYVSDYSLNETDKKGSLPAKVAIPTELFNDNKGYQFPAIVEILYTNVPDGKGKPQQKVVGMDWISPAVLFPVIK